MKKRGLDFIILIVSIYAISVNILNTYAEEGAATPNVNLTVTSHLNGTLTVSWDQPIIESSSGKEIYPAESYILGYSYFDIRRSANISANISTLTKAAVISNAYLGAEYIFDLYCQLKNIIIRCKNNYSVSAYPSCPKKWAQRHGQCVYMSKEPVTLQVMQQTCANLTKDLAADLPPPTPNEIITQMIQNNTMEEKPTLFWTGIDECNTVKPEMQANYNCCLVLTLPDNHTQTSSHNLDLTKTTCTSTQKLPFICEKAIPIVTSKVENITFASFPNNSVKVYWSESAPQGWNLLWRTVTYQDSSQVIQLNPNTSQQSAILQSLKPGKKYVVTIWPHNDMTIEDTAVTAKFKLFAARNDKELNGGCLQPVPFEAFLLLNGTARVLWKTAQAKKEPNEINAADSYQLYYGLRTSTMDQYVQVNTTELSYLIYNLKKDATYTLYLKCVFGQVIDTCGKISEFKIVIQSKVMKTESGMNAYDSVGNRMKTWQKAEEHCQNKNGHLLSISSPKEEEYLSTTFVEGTSYWIGGNSCNADGTPTWVTGEKWNYSAPMLNSTKRNQTFCCIKIINQAGSTNWSYENCNLPLQFVCKYYAKDLGILKNLTAMKLGSTIVQLQWKTPNHIFNVLSYDVFMCQLNSTQHNCSLYTKASASPVIIYGLSRNTTYSLQITAMLDSFNTSVNSSVNVTTGQNLDVFTNITSDGTVILSWPEENSFKDKAIFYIITPQNSGDALNQNESNGVMTHVATSNTTSLHGLDLGNTYDFVMYIVDNKTGSMLDKAPFTIKAIPSCNEWEYQYNTVCYWIEEDKVPWDKAVNSCSAHQGILAEAITNAESSFLRQVAGQVDDIFWIEGKTSLLQIHDKTANISENAIDYNNSHARQKRGSLSSPNCRMISPDTDDDNGFETEKCEQLLAVMCQRQPLVIIRGVSEVRFLNITNTTLEVTWTTSSWKPTSYEIKVTPMNNATENRQRRATNTAGSITQKDNWATINNLEPNTEYSIDIIPTIKSTSYSSPLIGEAKTVHVTTLDGNSPSQHSEANAMTSLTVEENETHTDEVHVADQINTFHIISCATLIGLVAISLVIFFICRMYKYRDCMSEIFSELSLLIVHTLILVDTNARDQVDCTSMAICIHYFFMTCFVFFALECFCHVKAMTNMIPLKVLNRSWQLFLIGWGLPLIIVLISSFTIFDHYVKKNGPCWLNLEDEAVWATIFPIGIFAAVAFVCLCLSICGRPDENYEVDEESYIRYEPMQDIRWILLFIFGLLISHWALGMVATHQADSGLYIAFVVLNIILGIAILMLRCFGDDQIRQRIRRCTQGTSIEPGEGDIDKYLSTHEPTYNKKGMSNGPGPGDGCLIIKKSYIFRP